ncbi:MAG: pseudaminic acid synthase [Lachnospiraceae bacterium]|nr:pseudaminic acid synthase [Lachnospiraceae bacterium]
MKLYEKINNNGIYIIAEMSANHGGDIDNAYRIIEEAAKAGADCVKIQTYTADTLTINCDKPHFKIKGGLWDGFTFYDLYKEAYTPWEWQGDLKKKCEEVGVDFLSTPFDNTAVDFLESIDVEAYKIASFELVDIPLIEYAASKGKPMIMSCGMASVEEIKEAVDACRRQNNDQIVLLKCCSQYPAKYEDMNLSVIPDMKERFGVTVGLSDHSFGSLAPIVAVTLGAKVVEKHVMLDDDKVESADSGFSMKMSEFKQMVEDINNTVLVQGKPSYELTENEKNNLASRRSLFAVKDIKKGELFTKENVRSIRPGIGLKPKYYSNLMGKCAKREYEFGDPISEDEL